MGRFVNQFAFDVFEEVPVSGVGDSGSGLDEASLRAMGNAGDMLKIIAEMIVGYRKTLVDGGVGIQAADDMAHDFHDVLLAQMTAGLQQHAQSSTRAERRQRR